MSPAEAIILATIGGFSIGLCFGCFLKGDEVKFWRKMAGDWRLEAQKNLQLAVDCQDQARRILDSLKDASGTIGECIQKIKGARS